MTSLPTHGARGKIISGLRPAFPLLVLVLLASSHARAEDVRVTFLAKQLKGAKDPRVRAQTVLILGQTGSPDAVPPLCEVLADPEAVVRTAAASALGELKAPSAIDCLKGALGESDPAARAAMEKALALLQPPPPTPGGGLYFNVEPIQDKVGGLPDTLLKLTDKLLRERLTGMGALFAPPNEEKKAAAALIKMKGLKAYQLRLQVLPGGTDTGLKVEMLIMTYPDQSLKGTWNVKAKGGKPEAQIKALVPKLVDDAAGDLEWKK